MATKAMSEMTDKELLAGIDRGQRQLAVLDSFDTINLIDDFDGPFPPSKNFENWNGQIQSEKRRLLTFGIREVQAELTRREKDRA